MATLTLVISGLCDPQTSAAIRNAISSLASADGRSRSVSRDGRTIVQFGPALVRASLSVLPDAARARPTIGTYGRPSRASLASAALQGSLASKLQAAMAGRGSAEYALTWKTWDMASGPPICALRASGRRISGNGCSSAQSGWSTPTTTDAKRGTKPPRPWDTGVPLTQQVGLAVSGWPTPTASGFNSREDPEQWRARQAKLKAKGINGNGAGVPFGVAVREAAGWATPKAGDWRDPRVSEKTLSESSRPLNEQAHGLTVNGSTAGTEKPGVLNPEFVSRLMGFPATWNPHYRDTEMPSSRKSRRRS
jgi:hypothetical protein